MPGVKKLPSGRYEAWYRDPANKEKTRQFAKKGDAQAWLNARIASLVRGDYIDPKAGRITFGVFAEEWFEAQTFDDSTREAVELRLRVHILPTFGDLELRAIKASTVQAWLRSRQRTCAPRYVRVMLASLSAVLGAAAEDGVIVRNPCASRAVRAPAVADTRIVPWTHEQVAAVIDAHPDRWRAIPVVAAGCGLRQGEVFGLRVSDVDFLRHKVLVCQQVKLVGSKPILAPPKGQKTREVSLPDHVAVELAEHLRQYPALDGLVFTTRTGHRMNRNTFNTRVWKAALSAAGVETARGNGMHALRHWYASVQLEAGTSIRALAEYLGHADPGFTLRTYTHLMPTSEDRAREAIDAAFGNLADSSRTTGASEA